MKTDFIEIPNLPKRDVAVAAASGTYPEFIRRLQEFGIEMLQIQPSKRLSTPVCSHADMLCHHLERDQIIVAKGEETLLKEFRRLNFIVTESSSYLDDHYPDDILLNAARVGHSVFAHKEIDNAVLDYYKRNKIHIEFVRQGYAKCSVAVIDQNSIITADEKIAEAASKFGANVLKISPGYIKLDGYNYGFIGGCCGLISNSKIVFTGDLHMHPDYLRIKNFIESRNIKIISLTDGELVDVGGIIPLKEYV